MHVLHQHNATLTPHQIPANDLKPGDQIQDRGALHTIDEIDTTSPAGYCIVVIMDDGGRLGIEPSQPVTVWRTA